MRKSLCCLLLAASFLGCGLSVNALERPTASQYDARVMYTDYKPGQVYPIRAANGLITTITFSPEASPVPSLPFVCIHLSLSEGAGCILFPVKVQH